MKKVLMTIAAIAAAFTISSCAKEEGGCVPSGEADFYASIEGPDTRAGITSEGFVTWDKTDRITVNGATYSISTLNSPVSAEFKYQGGQKPAAPYHAFFPVGIQQHDSIGLLPNTWKYEENSANHFPMYSYGTSNELQFKNLCALLKVSVDPDVQVTSIKVESNSPLCGEFHISADGSMKMHESAECSKISIDCGSGVSGASTFYIPVPPGDYSKCQLRIAVEIVNSDGLKTTTTQEIATGAKVVLSRNTIYPFDFRSAGSMLHQAVRYFVKNVASPSSDRDYSPLFMAFNLPADYMLFKDEGRHSQLEAINRFSDKYTADNEVTTALFDGLLNTLNQVNNIFDVWCPKGIERFAGYASEDEYKKVMAEARVFRAYLEFLLAAGWGKAPLLETSTERLDTVRNSESRSDLLGWCVSECETAISSGKLPDRNGYNDKNGARVISQGFARALAGKCAVFNNDFAAARRYLGDVISSGDYALVLSNLYYELFWDLGNYDCEKIWDLESEYSDEGFEVYNWNTKRFVSDPSSVFSGGVAGYGCINLSPDAANGFLAHDGNSPRRTLCFFTKEETFYECMDLTGGKYDGKYKFKSLVSGYDDWTLEQKNICDAVGITKDGMPYNNGCFPVKQIKSRNIHANITVMRYAEVLLLYAEACIGSSDEPKGLKALHEVQKRSGSGKISSSLTLNDVIEEKFYEMFMEGCRYLDLCRWAESGKIKIDSYYKDKDVYVLYDKLTRPSSSNPDRYYTVNTGEKIAAPFQMGKHDLFPYPTKYKNLKQNPGW